jgi:hypothetical protein
VRRNKEEKVTPKYPRNQSLAADALLPHILSYNLFFFFFRKKEEGILRK